MLGLEIQRPSPTACRFPGLAVVRAHRWQSGKLALDTMNHLRTKLATSRHWAGPRINWQNRMRNQKRGTGRLSWLSTNKKLALDHFLPRPIEAQRRFTP